MFAVARSGCSVVPILSVYSPPTFVLLACLEDAVWVFLFAFIYLFTSF